MSLYEEIIKVYPELENSELFINKTILLCDDSDGSPQYIDKWDYEKPIPKGMKLGKDEPNKL